MGREEEEYRRRCRVAAERHQRRADEATDSRKKTYHQGLADLYRHRSKEQR
jgi:hypothetical protein